MAYFMKLNRDLTESTFSVGNITAPKGESHSHLKLIIAVSDCSKTCQGPPNNRLRWSLLPVLQAVAIWFELVEAPLPWESLSPTPFPHPFLLSLSLTQPKIKDYFCIIDLLSSSKNLQPPGRDSGISDSQKLEKQWMGGAKKSPAYLLQVDLCHFLAALMARLQV